jgi:hypothetical protein
MVPSSRSPSSFLVDGSLHRPLHVALQHFLLAVVHLINLVLLVVASGEEDHHPTALVGIQDTVTPPVHHTDDQDLQEEDIGEEEVEMMANTDGGVILAAEVHGIAGQDPEAEAIPPAAAGLPRHVEEVELIIGVTRAHKLVDQVVQHVDVARVTVATATTAREVGVVAEKEEIEGDRRVKTQSRGGIMFSVRHRSSSHDAYLSLRRLFGGMHHIRLVFFFIRDRSSERSQRMSWALTIYPFTCHYFQCWSAVF